ncbi:MAG: S41 family peptidase [Acidobacteria bacterium]|nr:S41 family peptidase [Acidobacteriota bacterium]
MIADGERPPVNRRAGVGGRLLFVCVSLLFVLGLASGAWLGASDDEPGTDSIYKYITLWEEVLRLIRGSYVEEVGGRGLMAGALDGVTDALDPFSVYVPASAVESYRAAREIGRRHSGLLVVKERGTAYVAAVDRGSPADLAGFERGDIVSMINGRSSREMPLWEVRRQLAGPVGSNVLVELVRSRVEDPLEVSLVLAEYDLLPPEFEEVGGVGVLTIPSFAAGTADHVDAALAGYEGDSLLIDLRGVAGGSVADAYEVAGRFAQGELGGLVDREDQKLLSFEGVGGLYSGDIAVLVDRSSQGAAEVLTAVLKKARGAELYGEPTFGYAGEVEQIELPNEGGVLELTSAFYTDPDGERLNSRIRMEQEHRLGAFFFAEPEDGSDPVLEGAIEKMLEPPAESANL